MKNLIITLLILSSQFTYSQTCSEWISYVRAEDNYPMTYNSSLLSEAISQVEFYDVMIDYQTYYFAIVCFKNNSFGCNEYIYQVGSNTKFNYSINYISSAGDAFWKYIQPYNSSLGCAPDFSK